MLDRQDLIRKKIAVKGFADSVSVKKRLEEVEKLCRDILEATPVRFEAVHNFPQGQKKLTGVVLVDFGSEKEAQDLVKSYKDTPFTVNGCQVKVANARTELQSKRNTQLREAIELVKATEEATGKTVETKFGSDRRVKVDGQVVFQQDKQGLGGLFSGAFSGLSLP